MRNQKFEDRIEEELEQYVDKLEGNDFTEFIIDLKKLADRLLEYN